MSDRDEKLPVLQTYASEENTWLNLRTLTETQIAILYKYLVDERHDKPLLVEDQKTRSLCFSIDGPV